jgi:phytoene synthase
MAVHSQHKNNAARRAADLAAGRALLRDGSRSFHIASLLLPRGTREAATALYAFCRIADDTIDLHHDAQGGLAQLRSQLDRVYDGNPLPQPVERLLAQAVRQHGIPRGLLDALLEGFEWDLAGRRYETISELNAYGARVAGSVGAMMTLLMGVRDPVVLARACDLGVAMQLTNIARDVGQDARAGRLYLPLAWMREAGLDPDAWLAQPVFNAALAGVIERLLCAADEHYARSVPGISRLPPPVRPGVHAARLLYAEIGNDLRRNGWNSVARRAHVKGPRKVRLVLAALGSALRAPAARQHAPLEETQFLLQAVQNCSWVPEAIAAATNGARHPRQGRVEWLLELFERLERLEQGERSGSLQSIR